MIATRATLCHREERSTAPPVADEAVRRSNEVPSGDGVSVPATMPNGGSAGQAGL